MKTGTLTFHAPNNNGSFLQAYALQQVLLREYGLQNEIIDFVSEQQARQYSVFRTPKSVGDLGRNAISLLHHKDLVKRANRFESMRKKHLGMTNRVTTEQEVLELAETYDLMICGSDQIWNTTARDFSPAYFLDGAATKKISYAVSSGSHLPNGHDEQFSGAKEFSAVSVREPELKEYLAQHGYAEAEVVCDPTLLLEQVDYYPLYNRFPLIHGKYILLYTINYDDEALRLTMELSKRLNLPVYAPFTGYSAVKCARYGIKVLYGIAPDGFLNLMHHAAYVVSNSFHGVAFSIIFEKHFYRPGRIDNNGCFIRDDRIDNLLDELHLDSQRVYDHGGLIFNKNAPDYNPTSNTKIALQNLRARSMAFLDRALEEETSL